MDGTKARAVAVIAVSLLGLSPQDTSFAQEPEADCTTTEAIFWADDIFGTWRTSAFGTRNTFPLAGRDINPACTNGASVTHSWSTAHLKLGGVTGNWVEVGWHRSRTPTGVITHWFTERAVNYNPVDSQDRGDWPCPPILNTNDEWAVTNIPGTDDWNMRLNCLDGTGNDHLLDTFYGTYYSKGRPEGETGRRGGTATGMSDSQENLRWKTIGGNFLAWTDPDCRTDYASNWSGEQSGSNGYNVLRLNFACIHV